MFSIQHQAQESVCKSIIRSYFNLTAVTTKACTRIYWESLQVKLQVCLWKQMFNLSSPPLHFFFLSLPASLHPSPSAFSNQEVYQQVTSGYRMQAPAKCPDFLYQIMLECWSIEPANRPDFKSLKIELDSSSYELEWAPPPTSCSTYKAPQRSSRESNTEQGLWFFTEDPSNKNKTDFTGFCIERPWLCMFATCKPAKSDIFYSAHFSCNYWLFLLSIDLLFKQRYQLFSGSNSSNVRICRVISSSVKRNFFGFWSIGKTKKKWLWWAFFTVFWHVNRNNNAAITKYIFKCSSNFLLSNQKTKTQTAVWKAANPHIWEAGTRNCLSFLLEKKDLNN